MATAAAPAQRVRHGAGRLWVLQEDVSVGDVHPFCWDLVKLTHTRVTFLRLGMALTLTGIMKNETPALKSRGTVWGRGNR